MIKLVLTTLTLIALTTMSTVNYSTKETKQTTKKDSAETGFAVVELFTSQGCSSCPPADEILRGLTQKDNVFPLSFHVTYWNRLGWKDSFSQAIFDERQYAYGARFALNGVYTPQAVINGKVEMVGSRDKQIRETLAKNLSVVSPFSITLTKGVKDKTLIINYKINKPAQLYDLNVALVESNIATYVQRGENKGQTLRHDNVVKYFKTIKMDQNTCLPDRQAEGVVALPFLLREKQSCIVYLQEKNLGQIVAAARVK